MVRGSSSCYAISSTSQLGRFQRQGRQVQPLSCKLQKTYGARMIRLVRTSSVRVRIFLPLCKQPLCARQCKEKQSVRSGKLPLRATFVFSGEFIHPCLKFFTIVTSPLGNSTFILFPPLWHLRISSTEIHLLYLFTIVVKQGMHIQIFYKVNIYIILTINRCFNWYKTENVQIHEFSLLSNKN